MNRRATASCGCAKRSTVGLPQMAQIAAVTDAANAQSERYASRVQRSAGMSADFTQRAMISQFSAANSACSSAYSACNTGDLEHFLRMMCATTLLSSHSSSRALRNNPNLAPSRTPCRTARISSQAIMLSVSGLEKMPCATTVCGQTLWAYCPRAASSAACSTAEPATERFGPPPGKYTTPQPASIRRCCAACSAWSCESPSIATSAADSRASGSLEASVAITCVNGGRHKARACACCR